MPEVETNMQGTNGHGRLRQRWLKVSKHIDTVIRQWALEPTILLRPRRLRDVSRGESATVVEVEKEKTTLRTAEYQANANTHWWHQSHGIAKAVWHPDQDGTVRTPTCRMNASGPLPRREQGQREKEDTLEVDE